MSDVEALQEEIATLRSQLAERDARLAELAASEDRLKVALLEIEQIKMQLALLRRQRYGHSSEKLDGEIVQLELRLEDLEETVGEQIAASPRPREPNNEQPSPRRKPTRASRCRRICRGTWWCMSQRLSAVAATVTRPA